MSVIKYKARDEESATNLSRNNFSSKWEYTQSISKWHFDKWRKEEDQFKVFMRVAGDWSSLVEDLKYEINVSTLNYGFQGKDHDSIIENDYLKWGYDKSMVQYNRTYDMPEKLIEVGKCLKLKYPDIRIHRQMPGMVAPIHVDTFCSHPATGEDRSLNVSEMRRFVIQLTDWDWGHMWMFGNNPWVQWKAGDVVYFESRDIIHCTANAGKTPRVTMIVTGWLTEETERLIEGEFQIVEV